MGRLSYKSAVVSASKQVTWSKQPQASRRSVLSDNKIALLKKRIDKSWNVRLDKLNGEVAERLQPRYRSSDVLLKQ